MGKILTKIVAGSALIGALASSACVPVGKGDYAAMMTNMNEAGRFANEVEANKIQRDRNGIYAGQQSREPPRERSYEELNQEAIRERKCPYNENYWRKWTLEYRNGGGMKKHYSKLRDLVKKDAPEIYEEYVKKGAIVED